MTSSASTTAACGLTTATTTSNTGPPVTAGVTSRPAQVSQHQCYALCFSCDHCSVIFLCVIPAVVFGDPHFITFDGVSYSFNGKGEYNLVTSAKKQLTIQGRTEPVNGEKAPFPVFHSNHKQTLPLKNANKYVKYTLHMNCNNNSFSLHWSDSLTIRNRAKSNKIDGCSHERSPL